MGLFDKLFGTRSQREIKRIQPLVNKILALEDEYRNLSEEELKAQHDADKAKYYPVSKLPQEKYHEIT